MIPSTGDLAIEQYADQVFNSIKIGHAKLDNGLLLVVAKDDRKMRLEVGYGLEGDISDIQAARIIRHIMQPEFKNENYYQGISDAQQSIEKLSNGFVINDHGSYINHQISQAASFFSRALNCYSVFSSLGFGFLSMTVPMEMLMIGNV